jgi:hypothetical protein
MLLEAFRRAVPNLAVSTDIIVGFPGETEADFQATYDFLAKARYDSAFLFKYSPRPGTKSYEWGDSIPEEEKLRRLQAVIDLQEKISLEKNQKWVGKTVEVLAEGPSKKSNTGNGDSALMSPLRRGTRQDFEKNPAQGVNNGHPTWFGKSPQFKTVVFKPASVADGAFFMSPLLRGTPATGGQGVSIKPGDRVLVKITRATSHTLFGAGMSENVLETK